jgi:hypothetical protein
MVAKAIKGTVLIKINVKQKEKYALTDSIDIDIEKGYNFNLREDRASFGYILDGENLPKGAACLVHHLSIEPAYEVPCSNLLISEEEIKKGVKVYKIQTDMCFCFRIDKQDWQPCKDFLITKRIFKPAIEIKGGLVLPDSLNVPERVKGVMYIVNGFDTEGGEKVDLSGLVVFTTENCDYQIIWHEEDNKEYSLIRTRNREIMAIDNDMTMLVKENKLLLGLDERNCKTLI